MDASWHTVAFIAAVFVFAGFVKGVIGLGLPSIAIGFLAITMPPAQAVALMIAPSLLTNLWQMLAGPSFFALLRRMGSLLATVVVGVWLGGGILTSVNSRYAALGLGVALLVYAVLGLAAVKFTTPRSAEIWLSPLVGLSTGFIAGATGVFVIPAGPYFQAIGLDKDELVQMLGLSFTVSTIALAAILWRDGVMQWSNGIDSMLAVIPALIGLAIGEWIRKRTSPDLFRRFFFGGLLLLGLQQAIRNLM